MCSRFLAAFGSRTYWRNSRGSGPGRVAEPGAVFDADAEEATVHAREFGLTQLLNGIEATIASSPTSAEAKCSERIHERES